ncbi:expressed protein [Phakopsora pachyrhizi]|uniref:Expressed protein n=1 Tax=Phakopsora pachyrhizi TaxID=170000 RepID=A0AAV0ATH2_PHAPC|nr:expressed protein [Phakopsora pachyrhizi]
MTKIKLISFIFLQFFFFNLSISKNLKNFENSMLVKRFNDLNYKINHYDEKFKSLKARSIFFSSYGDGLSTGYSRFKRSKIVNQKSGTEVDDSTNGLLKSNYNSGMVHLEVINDDQGPVSKILAE